MHSWRTPLYATAGIASIFSAQKKVASWTALWNLGVAPERSHDKAARESTVTMVVGDGCSWGAVLKCCEQLFNAAAEHHRVIPLGGLLGAQLSYMVLDCIKTCNQHVDVQTEGCSCNNSQQLIPLLGLCPRSIAARSRCTANWGAQTCLQSDHGNISKMGMRSQRTLMQLCLNCWAAAVEWVVARSTSQRMHSCETCQRCDLNQKCWCVADQMRWSSRSSRGSRI